MGELLREHEMIKADDGRNSGTEKVIVDSAIYNKRSDVGGGGTEATSGTKVC